MSMIWVHACTPPGDVSRVSVYICICLCIPLAKKEYGPSGAFLFFRCAMTLAIPSMTTDDTALASQPAPIAPSVGRPAGSIDRSGRPHLVAEVRGWIDACLLACLDFIYSLFVCLGRLIN